MMTKPTVMMMTTTKLTTTTMMIATSSTISHMLRSMVLNNLKAREAITLESEVLCRCPQQKMSDLDEQYGHMDNDPSSICLSSVAVFFFRFSAERRVLFISPARLCLCPHCSILAQVA